MISDSKSSDTSSPSIHTAPLLDDFPPSYDDVATSASSAPSYGDTNAGSSSQASASPGAPPKDTLYLYDGPPNPEYLLGKAETPLNVLESIETVKKGGYVYSADPRLQDATTLYDFLRHSALSHPSFKVKCTGRHFETPDRNETVQDRDGLRQRRKGQTECITDFQFTIDLGPVINHPDNYANVHLSTAPLDIPCSRGTQAATYSAVHAPPLAAANSYEAILGPTDAGRAATKTQANMHREWVKWRASRGLPPWTKMSEYKDFMETKESKGKGKVALMGDDEPARDEEATVGDSSQSTEREAMLKAWCEKYVHDQGLLKEFRMNSYIWGWDLDGLTTAIRGAIVSTGYNSNHLTVEFEHEPSALVVLPTNLLSRAVNNSFVYVLLWLTMIYPMIWLWQKMHTLGGAPYTVAMSAYALKFYPPLPSTFPGEHIDAAKDRLGGMYKLHRELPKPTHLVYGPKGVHYLLGRKEGEWFREWEERIRMGVRTRFRGELEGGGEEEAGRGLDGY